MTNSTTITFDITREFLKGFDVENTIDRDGRIDVSLRDKEIQLTDRSLNKIPWNEPARINLDRRDLFAILQRCRENWKSALEDTKVLLPGMAGQKHRYPYADSWRSPVDETAFQKLGAKLAVAGEQLFRLVFERDPEQKRGLHDIAAYLREHMGTGERVWNVFSADFDIPWRMLYTHPSGAGSLAEDGSNFVLTGFWGYQHIIGQYTKPLPPDNDVVAKSKVSLGAALDEQIDAQFGVTCISRHREYVRNNSDLVIPTEWTNIKDLTKALGAKSFEHQVLYFLCHAEVIGTDADPFFGEPFLKLTEGKINASDITLSIRDNFRPSPPLIFINACQGGQRRAFLGHSFTFASQFLNQGAVCVIGPQIEIPAVFAGEFGKLFFERFIAKPKLAAVVVELERPIAIAERWLSRLNKVLPPQILAAVRRVLFGVLTDGLRAPPRAGVILRDLTRDMWEFGNPFGLVYSLYASADCKVRWEEER